VCGSVIQHEAPLPVKIIGTEGEEADRRGDEPAQRVVSPYATSGAYVGSRDALQAELDHQDYMACHWRDGTAGPLECTHSCYRL
jgi:hypothetical protein